MQLNIKFTKNNKGGFTLIELLVTIVIFVMITGIVLVNQNRFDSTVLLNNLTYDVALTIKQAQTYGVNTVESAGGSVNGVYPPYGAFFNTSASGGSRTNFVLFTDNPNYPTYNYSGSIISCPVNDAFCVQKYSVKSGNYISAMCAGLTDDDCNKAPNQVNKLRIVFKRPNLGAIIYVNDDTPILANQKDYAKITLSSADGSLKGYVVVTKIGQIYIKK